MRWFVVFVCSILLSIGLGVGALQLFGAVAASSSTQSLISAFRQTAGERSDHLQMQTTITTASGTSETASIVGDQLLSSQLATGAFTVTARQVEIDERFTPDSIYFDYHSAVRLPHGATWMGVSTKGISKALDADAYASQFSGANGDPQQILSLFAAADPSKQKQVGSRKVNGVATTEYQTTINLNRVVKDATAGYGRLLQSLERYATTTSIPVSVWVDQSGRVRQLSYNITESINENSAATSVAVAIKLELSDFGTRVVVSVPPQKTVYELPTAKVRQFFSSLNAI